MRFTFQRIINRRNGLIILAIISTLAAWFLGQQIASKIHFTALGNIFGFFILLGFALSLRFMKGTVANVNLALQPILKEIPFVFLPICAGWLTVWHWLSGQRFAVIGLVVFTPLLMSYPLLKLLQRKATNDVKKPEEL